MAILPVGYPTDHQESMFETPPETEARSSFQYDDQDSRFETGESREPDMSFQDESSADHILATIESSEGFHAETEFLPPSGMEETSVNPGIHNDAVALGGVSAAMEEHQEMRPLPSAFGGAEPGRVEPAGAGSADAESTSAGRDPYAEATRKAESDFQAETAVAAAPEAASDPLPVLTANEFTALEERILRAVALVRSERQARISAEQRVVTLESEVEALQAQAPVVERLQQEVDALRLEREQVRQRVDRLLSQLDVLEL